MDTMKRMVAPWVLLTASHHLSFRPPNWLGLAPITAQTLAGERAVTLVWVYSRQETVCFGSEPIDCVVCECSVR